MKRIAIPLLVCLTMVIGLFSAPAPAEEPGWAAAARINSIDRKQ